MTYIEPVRMLRVSGPMGLRRAAMYVKTYRLEPVDGRTKVRTSAAIFGAISPDTVEDYRRGGLEVLQALKAHMESVPVIAG